MPSADFWLDWTLTAPVDDLRQHLPGLAEAAGYRVEEHHTAASGPGWAAFTMRAPGIAEPVGIARAQNVDAGSAQMFVGPGAARDDTALAELNRLSLHLYVELIRRGLLAPPPPLERPSRHLLP